MACKTAAGDNLVKVRSMNQKNHRVAIDYVESHIQISNCSASKIIHTRPDIHKAPEDGSFNKSLTIAETFFRDSATPY